jgi:hypothetical protein
MTAPRRSRYLRPITDADSRQALTTAIDSLCAARGIHPPDPTAYLHALASLIAQADASVGNAVHDARDYGCSWAEIADLLGVTRASAWGRFGIDTPAGHRSS